MGIFDLIKASLQIARTHKSLWLFGFLAGVSGSVNFSGSRGEQAAPPVAPTAPDLGLLILIGCCAVAVIVGFVILKFLSTGALIEGVRRARDNRSMTVREGFREGWAHWGVLLRVALLFAAAFFVSTVVLAGSCFLVWRALGQPALYAAIALAVIVGLPWLVTLVIWHAFSERIAVFENRRAMDAIRKARLFLHGRLQLGLKLIVAALLGVVVVGALSLVVLIPMGGLVAVSALLGGTLAAVALSAVTLLPVVLMAIALFGVMTSSVWTIGYLTQVEQ